MRSPKILLRFVLAAVVLVAATARAEFVAISDNQPVADVVVDTRGASGDGPEVLRDAGEWLVDSLKRASGTELQVIDKPHDGPAIVIARADAWPGVAATGRLKGRGYNSYCIITEPKRVYVLGNSEAAARYGIAHLLRHLGFRWFAPSPRWHIVPRLKSVAFDVNAIESPELVDRRIWYAYGMGDKDLKPLLANYNRWAIANRLSVGSLMQTGHSYGNIIGRNREEFAQHPEYFALLADGQRDNQRAINARKLCCSDPGLIELVTRDRLRLLEEKRRVNPAAFMVSVDPSDGEGTCHCEDCRKIGTTTDRVIHLANHVARGLKAKHPDAWVGLYAYSSHRLPPTVAVEPNVYVQVALGFNRTQYTLPELVELWSKRVGAIGLREYYGVEAWDWGLPGRMRGARVDYHRKWIPFYAERKLNAINAETNANWGTQTLGLYVAAQLMWNPKADVDSLVDEYFQQCFGSGAEPMRRLQAQFDAAPPLRAATLLPMFRDLQDAWGQADDKAIRERLVDLMAYLVYVAQFRDFDLVRARDPQRGDEYYGALEPLMNYVWRIRHRDMVHYYALARRLCNGLPVQDKRMDFYMFNKERLPIWKHGEPPTDGEIAAIFRETLERLEADGDPTVHYSRYFEPLRTAGADAGASSILGDERVGIARFRKRLRGYLVPSAGRTVHFAVAPTGRQVMVTVYLRGETVLFEKQFRAAPDQKPGSVFHGVEIELPKANEYRVEIEGDLVLQVPSETPFIFEASVMHPAWIDYSGPHYFYVPRGTQELIVDASPRLSLFVPSQKQRIDVSPASRKESQEYAVIPITAGASGQVWHTSNMTRGQVALLNVPPLLSFHRHTMFVPREVAESEGLTTHE